MKNYTLTQKILSLANTYQATESGSKEVLMTVKHRIISMKPYLELIDKSETSTLLTVKGDFFRIKYSITDLENNAKGAILFPLIPFIRCFQISYSGKTYKANGAFLSNKLICRNEKGKIIFTASKDFSFKDRIYISVDESFNAETAFLAAVIIDRKYFTSFF